MPSLSSALTSRMNFLTERQAVVASNIANANTPGYLARDLVENKNGASTSSFAMAMTNAQHMKTVGGATQGRIVEDARFIEHNGNSVRLDEEMLKMNDAQINYRFMTELYTKQVGMQKMALGNR